MDRMDGSDCWWKWRSWWKQNGMGIDAMESEMINGGACEKETGSQTKIINPKMGMPGDSRINQN